MYRPGLVGSRSARLLVAALAAVALSASAATASVRVLFLESGNRTETNRTARTIDQIVVHSTEGSFVGSVRWLRNRRSHGSAHYVVSRRGEVIQLVSTSDVAWHAGNRRTNRRSIGIEHEGRAHQGGFPELQYRASARLAAYLAHRYGIPLDRRHVIAHGEVPHPRLRGVRGGASRHTDPGPHWRWRHYLALVRGYARSPEQPRYVRHMTIRPSTLPPAKPRRAASVARRSVVDRGATVRAVALWWSGIDARQRWRKRIRRVDFLVDGRPLWTDRVWPFAFRGGEGWDTRTVANGRHMLVVRAYGRRGYRLRKSIPVRVVNPPMRLRIAGAGDGAVLHGRAALSVRTGEPTRRVTLSVDGQAVSRDGRSPYRLRWDTRSFTEGGHVLTVRAEGRGGRRVVERIAVVVANADDLPASLRRAWRQPADLALSAEPLPSGIRT
jgi:N-acetyl-anhydromuramyl-L-alanine amidase AmpD